MSTRNINNIVSNTINARTINFTNKSNTINAIDQNGTLINTGINISNFSKELKILASDGAANDRFGYSVSIDGSTAVVGSPLNDENGGDSGSAYIFEKFNGVWFQTQKITASDAAVSDQFGWSVDISGDTIIVGSYLDDDNGTNSGSAYIFEKTNGTWSQVQKITASDGALGDQFGYSVAIDGDSIIVGAFNDNNQAGSAYIFDKSNGVWPSTETQKIIASDGESFDRFGFSVDISNDIAIAGAYWDINTNGSVYIFNKKSGVWPSTETQKITASDGANEDRFGWSVAIDNNTIIVGSYQDDDNGNDSGSAYIFDNIDGIWSETQKITASDGAANDNFGISVAISNNTIVVGAHLNDDNANDIGSAYIFQKNGGTWVQIKKFVPSDGAFNDNFGRSVNISGNVVIIGSILDNNDNGADSGSAYIYDNTLVLPSLITDELSATSFVGNLTFKDRLSENKITAINKCGRLINTVANINSFSHEQIITSSDIASGDNFGWSVAIDENTAVIGAIQDDDLGSASGSAYIFEKSITNGVWTQIQKIIANDGQTSDSFGFSVDIDGDKIIVGTTSGDGLVANSGAAYIFEKTGSSWSQVQKITASDGVSADQFGRVVSIDGDIAVVGSPFDDDNGSSSGSAYIFEKINGLWPSNETHKITASDAASGDRFGFSVGISGNTIVIGANGDSSFTGSAYIFEKNIVNGMWSETKKITASDGVANDSFGESITIDGNTIIVGAPYGNTDLGAAYIFEKSNNSWPSTETQKIVSDDVSASDFFGISTSIDDNLAIIGAYGTNLQSGDAYVFEKTDGVWNKIKKLLNNNSGVNNIFGNSVSISNNIAIIGCPRNDINGADSGQAYIYDNTIETPSLIANSFNTGTGPMGGHIMAYPCEGDGVDVGDRLAFGKATTNTYGVVMPVSGKVLYITISTPTNDTAILQLVKNGVITGDSVSLSSSQSNSAITTTTFIANDALSLRVSDAPLGTINGSIIVQYD